MKVRLFLAHFAEVQAGMLYGLGIGWTEIGPEPSPFSVAAILDVDWHEANRPHELKIDIVDVDGQPFVVPTPTGDQPFQIGANFDVGRPPGSTAGRVFVMPVAMNMGPLVFTPGRHYVMRAAVDGTQLDEVRFIVRSRPQVGGPT